ncbi:MAG: tol-pal system-associated acyl-CoA thioesterase [Proteobacteria bacterium]|nr:tol-pal system-associated acyl-CoA thioesterase [Pseudomonadota bacterium]
MGSGLTGEFSLSLRVYIEDTDAGGIVYYVNYLKFMERCRTELMRSLGFDKNFIFNEELMFVVRDVSVTYLKPAKLDDELIATAHITQIKGATMTLQQSVRLATEVLAQGEVTIVCVDKQGLKPRRIPKSMVEKIQAAPL